MEKRNFKYTAKEKEEELPIKELLKRNFGFSSRLMAKLRAQGGVELNGKPAKMYVKVEAGDCVTVTLPQEKSSFEPERIPISVVYEDEDLLIINKQPGFVVHPTKGHPCHTMANGIMNYMKENHKNFKIRFINRLDMDTSGLLVIAKNSHCQDNFAKQMSANTVIKRYVAVVKGIIKENSGTINLPIGKKEEDLLKRAVVENGYPSVTHYKVLETYTKGYTLVELLLETGRTHQIRVHLSHLGYPVVGDVLYGEDSIWLIERQALHAKYLSFRHPASGKFMEVEAPLPSDMEKLLQKVKS